MTTELIEHFESGVLMLALNRPERLNAMTRPMLGALLAVLRRAAADPQVRVMLN